MKKQNKEPSLSKKRHDPYGYGNYEYPEEDVKLAVRKLKEELGAKDERDAEGNINEGVINRIFGEVLSK